jgi:hypothetical protein
MALSRKEKDQRSELSNTPEIPAKEVTDPNLSFIQIKYDKEGSFQDIKIKLVELRDALKKFGFVRYDIDKEFIYVKLSNNIIEEVTANRIIDEFEEYLDQFPERIDLGEDDIKKSFLMNKIFNGIGTYFSDKILARLRPDEEIQINSDNVTTAHFYYENGFVTVTADGYEFKKYKNLTGYVWKDQILKRNFKQLKLKEELSTTESIKKEWGVFADFCFKISGQDPERLLSLMTIIGYNLHNFTDRKCKATILTDSSISERAEGRTGKTLLGKCIGQMVNANEQGKVYVEISGKDFDPTYKHKYQDAAIDTKIIHLNDVVDYFQFNALYNDITEGISINRKGESPLRIKPKIIISTNRTIRIEGASDKDRCIEFELANYFSDRRSPEQEYGHWFFRDWNQDEWTRFDNFMILCTMTYLRAGIMQPKTINLERRKLMDHCSREFVEWMDDLIRTGTIKPGDWYDQKQLNDDFMAMYHDYRNDKRHTQRRFNRWLQNYANLTPTLVPYDENKHRRKRNDGYDMMFELNPETT